MGRKFVEAIRYSCGVIQWLEPQGTAYLVVQWGSALRVGCDLVCLLCATCCKVPCPVMTCPSFICPWFTCPWVPSFRLSLLGWGPWVPTGHKNLDAALASAAPSPTLPPPQYGRLLNGPADISDKLLSLHLSRCRNYLSFSTTSEITRST